MGLPVELIEKVASVMTVAEDQPVATACPARRAVLEKGAKRGDAGAGADQDEGRVVVHRKPETGVFSDRDPDRLIFAQTAGEEARGAAQTLTSIDGIAQQGDRQMHLVGDLGLTGGDGIETRTQRLEQSRQRGRFQMARMPGDQINELARAGIVAQPRAIGAQVCQRVRTGPFGPGFDDVRVQLGQLQPFAQCLTQRQIAVHQGDGTVPVELQPRQDLIDQRRVVAEPDPERIAGREPQPLGIDRECQMMDLTHGIRCGQPTPLDELRQERAGRCRYRCDRFDVLAAVDRDDLGPVRFDQTGSQLQHTPGPVGNRLPIVHIAALEIQQRLGAQFPEPGIERPGGLTELGITGVAQTQHCVAQRFQPGRTLAVQILE